jgi:hypothetical protein
MVSLMFNESPKVWMDALLAIGDCLFGAKLNGILLSGNNSLSSSARGFAYLIHVH